MYVLVNIGYACCLEDDNKQFMLENCVGGRFNFITLVYNFGVWIATVYLLKFDFKNKCSNKNVCILEKFIQTEILHGFVITSLEAVEED